MQFRSAVTLDQEKLALGSGLMTNALDDRPSAAVATVLVIAPFPVRKHKRSCHFYFRILRPLTDPRDFHFFWFIRKRAIGVLVTSTDPSPTRRNVVDSQAAKFGVLNLDIDHDFVKRIIFFLKISHDCTFVHTTDLRFWCRAKLGMSKTDYGQQECDCKQSTHDCSPFRMGPANSRPRCGPLRAAAVVADLNHLDAFNCAVPLVCGGQKFAHWVGPIMSRGR